MTELIKDKIFSGKLDYQITFRNTFLTYDYYNRVAWYEFLESVICHQPVETITADKTAPQANHLKLKS